MGKTPTTRTRKAVAPKQSKGLRFRTQFNETYQGDAGEEMDSQSLTVPDMDIGIRQLIINNSRGIENDIYEMPENYTEDMEIPTYTDMSELWEAKMDLEDQRKELQEKVNKELKEEKKPLKTAKKDLKKEVKEEQNDDKVVESQNLPVDKVDKPTPKP